MPALPVTVGVPTFNSESFVADCLSSILEQDFEDFELLIVDNSSTDHTLEIINSFRDSRIKIFKNEVNKGAHFSIDRLHEEAAGRFIRILCSDDVMLAGSLRSQFDLAASIPGIALVTCDFILTDCLLSPIGYIRNYSKICWGEEVRRQCFREMQNLVGGPSNYFYPTALAKRVRLCPEIKFMADLDYALQLLKFGLYANTCLPGLLYRRHPHSDTNRVWSEERAQSDWLKMITRHGEMNHAAAIWFAFKKTFPEDRAFLKQWWKTHFADFPGLCKGALQSLKWRYLANE